jgi:hypothetical protein
MKNSIVDVRSVLIEQLERLNAPDCDIEKEYLRAQAMQMVANPIIASAKIEADLISKSGGKYSGTGFIREQKQIEA